MTSRQQHIRAAAHTHAGTKSANQVHDESLTVNERIALTVTKAVGTMGCVYLFAALTLPSAPTIWTTGTTTDKVSWATQTFLQLVLLPLLMVGSNIAQRHAEIRAELDHELFLLADERTVWIADALTRLLQTPYQPERDITTDLTHFIARRPTGLNDHPRPEHDLRKGPRSAHARPQ